MKKIKLLSLFILILVIGCSKNKSEPIQRISKDITSYVDPFIGTGGHGHTFPGATLPYGMVQLSPDTRMENWDGSSGYHYSDNTIMGFSHTHLSGTGAPEYCDILLMPTVGKVQILVGDEKDTETGYRSTFSHNNEKASPGYYSVLLDDSNVKVELTATTRAGFHQYTFPSSKKSNIIIDLKNRDQVLESSLQIQSDTEISGFRRSTGWVKDQHVYFYAKFSKPFQESGIALNDTIIANSNKAEGKNIKAYVSFQTKLNEKILVKVGISSVSVANAKLNLETEIKDWDFVKTKNQAKTAWNKHLSKIEIEGGSEKQRRIFYTSLYHAAMEPNIFNDVDGRYRGVDLKVHKTDGFNRYTVFSLWDVFRSQMPLISILEPSKMNDFIKTFLTIYKNGGRLPHWEIWGNRSGSMIGHHSLPVILDAYNKGIRNYDASLAFEAMKNQVDHDGYYAKLGFIPSDKETGTVSIVMENAYNDWCVAEMAKNVGAFKDSLMFLKRSQFYRNIYDNSTGFMRPKSSDRKWVAPFDPARDSGQFVEGNAFQYSLFAPHDISGLIELIGGDKIFEKWLDRLFTEKSKYDEDVTDASGLIGQYAHGNEPSHNLAYMYNYVGAPSKTQKIVSEILDQLYDDQPDGISGNEDCGQLSAWYILSSMGFYPVTPGDAKYNIGTPLFEKITINLENGKQFSIEAKNVSKQNLYIQSATLNGKPYTRSWFDHKEILHGGSFIFEMGAAPNKNWGVLKRDRPFTTRIKPVVTIPFIENTDPNFYKKVNVSLKCDTPEAIIYYSLDGTEPTVKSLQYTSPFQLNKTSLIKFIAVKKGLLNSIIASKKLNSLEFEKYHDYSSLPLIQGLKYTYFEGDLMHIADLEVLKPLEAGVISNFSIEKHKRNEDFGFIYSGFIKIPRDGAYTFYNKTNDGSILYLDGKELINDDGGHPALEKFITIALKKGIYKIDQKYFQIGFTFENTVSWKGPGFEKQEIPAKALFYKKEK